jgi:tetratricopeptide (TPR) repeat protein
MGYEMLHPSQVIVKQLQETLEKFSDTILNVVGKDESVEEVAKIRKISPYKLDEWEFLNYRNLVDPNECGKMLNELISENRKKEQLKVAHASLEKFPENEDLLSIVGMLEMSNKNWWLASFYFEKLIEKQKDRVELTTYENLLESLIRANQFDTAYKFIATVLKKWPNSQKILDILVMLQRATKSNFEGIAYLRFLWIQTLTCPLPAVPKCYLQLNAIINIIFKVLIIFKNLYFYRVKRKESLRC